MGPAAADVPGLGRFPGLCELGGAFRAIITRSGPYLSPFYSPVIFGEPGEDSWFGAMPAFIPSFVTGDAHPDLPGRFRLTCYYYRGAYYKAFWADPPSCAVGEPRKSYLGERSFPLILQNIHRYFLSSRSSFLVFLAYDASRPCWFAERLRHRRRHAGADASTSFCWAATSSAVIRSGTWWAACSIMSRSSRCGKTAVRLRELPERPPHDVGLGEPVLGRVRRSVRTAVLDGHLDGLENSVNGRISDASTTMFW